MSLQLKKVKLVKDKTLKLAYIKNESDGKKTNVVEEHTTEVHPDLKAALAELTIHFAVISEFVNGYTQVKDIDNVDPALTKNFFVSGYSLAGELDEEEGIVITGRKTLKNGKALIMNTPYTIYSTADGGTPEYRFHLHLINCLSKLDEEVLAYINGEKKAAERQTKMELDV